MTGLYRKVIRITAEDSPNVRRALAQRLEGKEPDGEIVVPGVLSWQEYLKRRATWDAERQSVGLDAQFWEGQEILLFPPDWLNESELRADLLANQARTGPRSLGCDPAEGGDKTAWAVSDHLGLLALISKRTSDTSVITSETIAIARQWGVPSERWCFDRGGGGLSHADRLQSQGFRGIRTVPFGESLVPDPRQVPAMMEQRMEDKEQRYVYVKRRAQLFGELSLKLDPSLEVDGYRWAIPRGITGLSGDVSTTLRDQLAPIPKTFDADGRLFLIPKNKPGSEQKKRGDDRTLVKLIGHSPDEADAVVLSLHVLLHPADAQKVWVLF